MDKLKKGTYVRAKKGFHILTGRVTTPKDGQGRYLVRYDTASNDTSVLTEGLYYEDELEMCEQPGKAN